MIVVVVPQPQMVMLHLQCVFTHLLTSYLLHNYVPTSYLLPPTFVATEKIGYHPKNNDGRMVTKNF